MKKKFNFVMIAVLLIFGCNFTENNKSQSSDMFDIGLLSDLPVDSLEKIVETGTNNIKIEAMYSLCFHYLNLDTEKASVYAKRIYEMSKTEHNSIWQSKGAECMGAVYCASGNMDSSLFYYKESLSLLEKINDEERIAQVQLSMSLTQLQVLKYEEALDNVLKALDYYENTNNLTKIILSYNRLANLYEALGNQKKQEEYLYKALEISKQSENKEDLGFIYVNLALLKASKGDFAESEEFGIKAIECFRNEGESSLRYLGQTLYRVAFIYDIQYKSEQAKLYLKEAMAIAEKTQNKPLKTSLLILNATMLNKIGDFQTAYRCVKQAEELADTTNQLEMNHLYFYLTACAIYAEKSKEAANYLDLYNKSKNMLQDQMLSEKASEMEIIYETAKKDLEIDQQKNIIARQKMQHRFWIACAVVAIIILVMMWYMLRLRNRHNRSLSEKNIALQEKSNILSELNNALTEINATKDKFFSIISHDLKSPAIALRDALNALLENSAEWDANTIIQYYGKLLKSADNQVNLLYNLLDWAQLQTGRMSCKYESFDLSINLRDVISLINEISNKKGLSFIVKIPENVIITGDSNMIVTVIRNLLTNAVKFTTTGGTVTLDIYNGKDVTRPVSTTIISIIDTGLGMNKKQIDNLFSLNEQHSRKGTAGEQGSGLGLIICKEFLEKHNSTLYVESEEGKGSRFWFEINCH